MKRLNLNIQDDIYKQLHESANNYGHSKTYIVETALKQYFEQNEDNSTSVQINQSKSANTEEIEELKSIIQQQQEKIDRIENLASSKVSREEVETALDNYTQTSIEDILDRLNLLEDNQRDHSVRLDNVATKDIFYGTSCLIYYDGGDQNTLKAETATEAKLDNDSDIDRPTVEEPPHNLNPETEEDKIQEIVSEIQEDYKNTKNDSEKADMIAETLIKKEFKAKDYKFTKYVITKWNNEKQIPKNPKQKHYLAYQVWKKIERHQNTN